MTIHSIYQRGCGDNYEHKKSRRFRFRSYGLWNCSSFSECRNSNAFARCGSSFINTRRGKKQLTLEDRQVRNRLSTTALAKLTKQKPAPLTSKSSLSLITPGNLEDHLQQLSDCDWIIEVVVERLDIKQQLFEKIDGVRKKEVL